jgi:hypothetical protein
VRTIHYGIPYCLQDVRKNDYKECKFKTLLNRMWCIQNTVEQDVVYPKHCWTGCGVSKTLLNRMWCIQNIVLSTGLLPCWQHHSTGLCSQPNESDTQNNILFIKRYILMPPSHLFLITESDISFIRFQRSLGMILPRIPCTCAPQFVFDFISTTISDATKWWF